MLIILAGVILLGAGALLINKPEQTQNNNTAQINPNLELLTKALQYGKNMQSYSNEFEENTDGYITNYKVDRSASSKVDQITVTNILSQKRAYFVNESTIICINYKNQETCDNVTGNADLTQYENFLKSKFPSNEQMERNVGDIKFLFDSGYLKINKVENKQNCKEIEYTLDFSNATINDGARFGIGLTSPKVFEYKICIEEETGKTVEKEFNYTLPQDQSFHYFKYTLRNSSFIDSQPQVPQEVGSGQETLRLLYEEKTVQGEITKCLIKKTTEEKDSCLNKKAIEMRMPILCELSSQKKEACLLSTIPIIPLESSCEKITNQSTQDDCYIEMTGATKNEQYCQKISTEEKKAQCAQVYQMSINETQTPRNNTNRTEQNETQVNPIAQQVFDQIG